MEATSETPQTVYLSQIEEGRQYELTEPFKIDLTAPWGSIEIGAGTTFTGAFGDFEGRHTCLGVKFNNDVNLESRLFNVASIPGVIPL